jgi:hypothetical protein
VPPTTTGYNSTAQADEILTALATDLTPLGVAVVTRGRLWTLPVRPCAVLIGPAIETGPLSFRQAEAHWTWQVLIARDVGENEERSEQIDTWADTALATVMDWLVQTSAAAFDLGAGDGPARVEDDGLVRLLQHFGERVDATLIQFGTRNVITHPACP